MNHCLEDPTGEQACPAPEAPIAPAGFTPDGEGAVPAGAAGEGEGCAPDATVAPAAVKGRILLLDDDPAFKDAIRDFLAENGYTVIAVQNGGEGIREVLAGDFALVLCDMRMPSLPGDLFYRAVERIRPELCGRFVFMTGYRGDAETTEFIEQISGFLLRKPFHLNDLLDWIAVTGVCSAHSSDFAGNEGGPLVPEVSPPAEPEPANGVRLFVSEPPAGAAETRAVRSVPTRLKPKTVAQPSPPPPRGRAASDSWAFAGLALFAGLAVVLGARYLGARERADDAALQMRKAQWAMVSADLREAGEARAQAEAFNTLPARVAETRDLPRWTPFLRRVVMQAGPEISFRVIRGRAVEGHPGACDLHIEGVATGHDPRALADVFRRTIEAALSGQSDARPMVRFKRLEDAPPVEASVPELRRAQFTISATGQEPEPGPQDSTRD